MALADGGVKWHLIFFTPQERWTLFLKKSRDPVSG